MGAAMARRRPKAKAAQAKMQATRDEAVKKSDDSVKENGKKHGKKSKG